MINRFSPAIVCGFAAGVLMTVPGLKNFTCCLIVPLAAYIALRLDQKLHGQHMVNVPQGIVFGLMTGLFSAFFASFFELLITYIVHSNDLIVMLPAMEQMLKDNGFGKLELESLKPFYRMAEDIKNTGFSGLYLTIFLVGNSIINSLFGAIGGLAGASVINNKNKTQQKEDNND